MDGLNNEMKGEMMDVCIYCRGSNDGKLDR